MRRRRAKRRSDRLRGDRSLAGARTGIMLASFGLVSVVSLGATPLGVAASLIGSYLVVRAAALWLATRRVTADDGGLRVRSVGRRRYVPFEQVSDAVLVNTKLAARPALLVLDESGRALVRKANLDAADMDAANDVLLAFDRWKQAHPQRADSQGEYPRNGMALDMWLRDLARLAPTAREAYRQAGPSAEHLCEVLGNRTASTDDRAAAAWMLLQAGDGESRRRVASTIDSTTPALVAAVAAAGCDAGELDAALVSEAREFVSAQDRAALARLQSGTAGERRAVRVAEPAERVRVSDGVAAARGDGEAEQAGRSATSSAEMMRGEKE